MNLLSAAVSCLVLSSTSLTLAADPPVKLTVDATDAPRRIFHSTLEFPVQPGPLTLVYPKWIPGEHAPSGPVTDVTGVHVRAGDKELDWRRDLDDMYAIHCEVPAGATSVVVEMNYLSPPSAEGFTSSPTSTAQLAVIDWHLFLMYVPGKPAAEQIFQANLKLPKGWKAGGALEVTSQDAQVVHYDPTTLEMLIDHPVVTGAFYRSVDLAPGHKPDHRMDMVADSDAALRVPDEVLEKYKRLVEEMATLFGSRHYQRYHFLVTLSDHVSSFGLEHHECSDDRFPERGLVDADNAKEHGSLMTHEFFHSWNGKFRRPAGLATSDYQQPMKDDLMWVYEGLTEYYGEVLAARCGNWTPEDYREYIAMVAARLNEQEGRTWRPLRDTCDAASLLYYARDDWAAHRRGVDFYDEGELIWLEADVWIRNQTRGKKSLDDFCRAFHGGGAGLNGEAPTVKPYTADDVYHALNEVASNDWREFFETRLGSKEPHAPLGGITAGGWKLVYSEKPNWFESRGDGVNLMHSLGIELEAGGKVQDAMPGTPAFAAGIGPGMRVVAVNGRKYTPDGIREALDDGKESKDPLELIVENNDFYSVLKIDYHAGQRHPHLERGQELDDTLRAIVKPRAR